MRESIGHIKTKIMIEEIMLNKSFIGSWGIL